MFSNPISPFFIIYFLLVDKDKVNFQEIREFKNEIKTRFPGLYINIEASNLYTVVNDYPAIFTWSDKAIQRNDDCYFEECHIHELLSIYAPEKVYIYLKERLATKLVANSHAKI